LPHGTVACALFMRFMNAGSSSQFLIKRVSRRLVPVLKTPATPMFRADGSGTLDWKAAQVALSVPWELRVRSSVP
jgi:hypothetical protein